MKEHLTAEEEYLSLIINYPEFLEKTIIKSEYLTPRVKNLFEILVAQYKEYKTFIIEKLVMNKNFDIVYYTQLQNATFYSSAKEIKFREFEKFIIEKYKQDKYSELTKQFNGDCKELYDALTKVNEINYNKAEYITAKEMFETLTQKNTPLKLGFKSLDYDLKLMETDLLIIGAGTGVGKTTFAINLLNNLSANYQCIYFNMEMSKTVLYKRAISNLTGLSMLELNDINKLSNEKKELLVNAMKIVEERKIIVVNKTLKTDEINKVILNTNTDKHIVAIIDHIGLIKAKGNSLYEKMTNTAKEIRAMCINSNCTIIGLCQLGREAQRREERPVLQDLRDSGEIEQSSRKAILLYNKSSDKQARIQDVEVIIAKNDDGEKTVKDFRFDKLTQTFYEKTS